MNVKQTAPYSDLALIRFFGVITSPVFTIYWVLLIAPLLFMLVVAVCALTEFLFSGHSLAFYQSVTPCFLTADDFAALNLARQNLYGHLAANAANNLAKIGWYDWMRAYIGVTCYILFFQILIIFILHNGHNTALFSRYFKQYRPAHIICIIIATSLYAYLLKPITTSIERVNIVNQQTNLVYRRIVNKQTGLPMTQINSDFSNIDTIAPKVAQAFGLTPSVLQQCAFSSNIHIISSQEKSYIGIN